MLGVARRVVPLSLRRKLRAAHQRLAFNKAFAEFAAHPVRIVDTPELASRLVYGWGNAWSAGQEYLQACAQAALRTDGPILECGSGLTTLIVGMIAQKRNVDVWSLEHDTVWGDKILSSLRDRQVSSVRVCISELGDYGEYCWYSTALDLMPDDFTLVICDGPPGATKGGRFGLLPVMNMKLADGCTILFDDVGRPQERAVAERWSRDYGADIQVRGSNKPFCVLTLRH